MWHEYMDPSVHPSGRWGGGLGADRRGGGGSGCEGNGEAMVVATVAMAMVATRDVAEAMVVAMKVALIAAHAKV